MHHQYYIYEQPKSGQRITREIAQELCNLYFGIDDSITKLRKIPAREISCKDFSTGKVWLSNSISYKSIYGYLEKNRRFDSSYFNLFEIKCEWLDGDTNVSLPQQIVGADNGTVKIKLPLTLGKNFPIQPMLDSEGVLYNSFQKSLTTRIHQLHNRLVTNSENFQDPDWLYDLITLFSNTVSLVDITLNQFYIKAQYDPLVNWSFDITVVGSRINRRMDDKFRWIRQITGNELDNVEQEMSAFKTLKELRNHTQHFDPPCFGFTLEEAAHWLNLIPKVALLLLKIRKKISSKPNEGLIGLALLPQVEFHGITLFDRERVISPNLGYESTKWNE